jgi:hypothetical protein
MPPNVRVPKLSFKFLLRVLPRRRHRDRTGAGGPERSGSATPIDSTAPVVTTTAPTVAHDPDKKPTASAAPSGEKQQEGAEVCSICHDAVGVVNPEGIVESWASLHCGHRFGSACLQTWLQESLERDQHSVLDPSCPVCRTEARHPTCGHAVVSPRVRPPLDSWHTVQYYHPPQRRPRRRLERRPGHPLRPASVVLQDGEWQSRGRRQLGLVPERRVAQVVGQCKTCADNAALDARMKQWAEQRRRNTADTIDSIGYSKSGILSAIPGLKRSAARATVRNVGFDIDRRVFEGETPRVQSSGCGMVRASMVLTGTAPQPQSFTITPIQSRRLSV